MSTAEKLRTSDDLGAEMAAMGAAARAAAHHLAQAPADAKTKSLKSAAAAIRSDAAAILAANARDMQAAEAKGSTGAFLDRLKLTPDRVADMAAGLDTVADLPDPGRHYRGSRQKPQERTSCSRAQAGRPDRFAGTL